VGTNHGCELELPRVNGRHAIGGIVGHLLLVDDELLLLEAIQELLSEAGHHVNAVTSAEDAVTTLENTSGELPNAIVTDIRLRGMSGIELLQKVRNHPAWQNIPFICLSASIPLEMEETISKQKGVAFLRKPFDIDDLFTVVSKVLAESSAN
jgi:two-component system, NtrC family, nitrogen regulation response regulator GlnG